MVFYPRRKTAKPKSAAPKRKYVRKVSRKPNYANKSLVKVVKSTILKMAEVKQSNIAYTSSILPYNSASFASTVLPVSPYSSFIDITQGVGQGQRIGNHIRIKKLTLSGVIFPRPYNVTTNPTPQPKEIKFIFMRAKQQPYATVTLLNDLFQYGSGSVAPQNTLVDQTMPFNKDLWHILKTKTFKVGYSNYSGTGVSVGNQSFTNNDFHLNCKFHIDLTKIATLNVDYQDSGGIPQTNMIQLVMLINNADGTISTATDVPCSVELSSNCFYTDL